MRHPCGPGPKSEMVWQSTVRRRKPTYTSKCNDDDNRKQQQQSSKFDGMSTCKKRVRLHGFRRRVAEKLALIFGMDVRSLAVARISLSLIVLLDVGIRLGDLEVFYTDYGAIPRSIVLDHLDHSDGHYISLWMAGGSQLWALICFGLTICAATLLLVGYKTRAASAVLWFLVMGYQNRAPILNNGGDNVLRLILFWSIFLPMGLQLSVDAAISNRRTKIPGGQEQVVSGATLAFIFQMAAIYYFSTLFKTGDSWKNGEAVYYALSLGGYAKNPFAPFILRHEWMWRNMTHLTFFWERYGPFMLLFPTAFGIVRAIVVCCFIFMHIGFYLCMELGLFPAICIVGWVFTLPGHIWHWIGWKAESSSNTPGNASEKSVAEIAFEGSWLEGLLRFGSFWLPFMFGITLIFRANMSEVNPEDWPLLPFEVGILNIFRLKQKWAMFSPDPLTKDHWLIIPGRLANGDSIELMQGGEVPWASTEERMSWSDLTDKDAMDDADAKFDAYRLSRKTRKNPINSSAMARNYRWFLFTSQLLPLENNDLYVFFAKHICQSWNQNNPSQLESFQIVYMLEETPEPPGKDVEATPFTAWSHNCESDEDDSAIGIEYWWSGLPQPLKEAAIILGFDEKSWDEGKRIPIYAKSLNQLTTEELIAVVELGLPAEKFAKQSRHVQL